MRVGAGGWLVPASPMRMSSRCSMYVSGVVSVSMLVDISRAWASTGVAPPWFHDTDSVGPT